MSRYQDSKDVNLLTHLRLVRVDCFVTRREREHTQGWVCEFHAVGADVLRGSHDGQDTHEFLLQMSKAESWTDVHRLVEKVLLARCSFVRFAFATSEVCVGVIGMKFTGTIGR